MKIKIATVCFNNHHIQKSMILKKNFHNSVDIFFLVKKDFVQQDVDKKIFLNANRVKNYDYFFFFALHPTKKNILLVKKIRELGKMIIAIQETFQLSTHNEEINNLILQANLVVAANDLERKMLMKYVDLNSTKVVSRGWLFEDKNLQEKIEDQNIKNLENPFVLIVLSAPKTITITSSEDDLTRANLIEVILKNYPHHNIKIKPHPNEEYHYLKKILKSIELKKQTITIIDNEFDYKKAINESSLIFSSNKSHATIDLIKSNKLVIYCVGPDNFINNYATSEENYSYYGGIKLIKLNKNATNKLCADLLNDDDNSFVEIENELIKLDHKKNNNFINEIYLWAFYKKIISRREFTKNISEDALTYLNKLEDEPLQITLNEMKEHCKSLSLKTIFFLFYLKHLSSRSNLENESNVEIFNFNINKWFIQYFTIDAIILKTKIQLLLLNYQFPEDMMLLLNESESLYKSKSSIFRFLITVRDLSTQIKIKFVRELLCRVIIYMLRLMT